MFYLCPVFQNYMAIMTSKNSTVTLFVYEFVFYGWWTSKHISLNKIWIIWKLTVSLTFSLIFKKNERYIAQHVFGFWIISHLLFDPHKSCMELVLLQLLLQHHFSYIEVEFLHAFTTSLKTQVKLCLFWLNSMAQSWRRAKEIGKEPWQKFLWRAKQETVLFTISCQLSLPTRTQKSLGKEKGP